MTTIPNRLQRALTWSLGLIMPAYAIVCVILKKWVSPQAFSGLLLCVLILVLLSTHRVQVKLILLISTLLLTGPFAFYHLISQIALSELVLMPTIAVTAPADPVLLGGGHLVLTVSTDATGFHTIIFTTSFYAGPDLVVGAAHKLDLTPATYDATFTVKGKIQFGSAELLLDSEQGVLVKLIGIKLPEAAMLPIGGTEQVVVGDTAEIFSTYGWSGSVTVAGYEMLDGEQYLVLTTPEGERQVKPGMSGSPVVQNGRIIGFLHSMVPGEYKGDSICRARLAADVYQAIVSSAPPGAFLDGLTVK